MKIYNNTRQLPRLSTFAAALMLLVTFTACDNEADWPADSSENEALDILMITGGGWHDYEAQKDILENGISERIDVEFTVDFEAGMDDNEGFIERHESTDWAQEHDLVLYNICFADNRDVEWSQRIVEAHVEHDVPAVVLHCSMHSYNHHDDDDTWRRFIGVRTPNHQHHTPYTVEVLQPDHPILSNFPNEWETPHGELYNIDEVYDTATPLAHAYGEGREEYQPNIWVNEYEGVRVFGTTIGHHNETMEHEHYLNLVTDGVLWAVGKLSDDGQPEEGITRAGYGQ